MKEETRNIVVLDAHAANPGDLSWEGLEQFGRLTVYERTSPSQVVERSAGAHILLTNKVVISDEVMARLPHLLYIGVMATGCNVVDLEAARRRNIVVTNVPAYSTDSVAQATFAHILNIANRVGHYARQNRQGRWAQQEDFSYTDTPLMELAGKTIGIVGLGNIGMKVASIAHQFGMDVFAMTTKPSASLPQGIQKATLDGLLATSDILTLHCPLTELTRHLINAERLQRMKQGAILINTGRGPLVDEPAVAAALQSGHLLAYGADVLCQEPPEAGNVLLRQPNAYITPHIAWATREARTRLMRTLVDNVKAFCEGHPQNDVTQS